jgi:hypothetical protein
LGLRLALRLAQTRALLAERHQPWCACTYLTSSALRFKRSLAIQIMNEVLQSKLEFCNERDKKGRLSYVFNQEDAAEVIAEIVQETQTKVIGACHTHQSRDARAAGYAVGGAQECRACSAKRVRARNPQGVCASVWPGRLANRRPAAAGPAPVATP